MKKILSIVASTVLLASLAATTVSADPAKGQKLYLKKLKKSCGINGAKMAGMHTQDEWESFKDAGTLEMKSRKFVQMLKM